VEHRAGDGTVDSHWDIDAKKLLTAIDHHYANKQNVHSCGQLLSDFSHYADHNEIAV